jgi:predicted dehydrogenase
MAPEWADRRQFLKAAGGAALASSFLAADLRAANDKVNVAFIGTGRMGSANIGFCSKVPGFEIVAVCDVYQPALDKATEQAKKLGFSGVRPVKDFRAILADQSVDAVCISTPDHWHAYMAIEAMKAGKDVWVEKPACVFVEEGGKMIEAARRYNRVVQGGTMQRSGAFFQKAREIVKRGDLGAITFCNTFQAAVTERAGFGNPPDSDPPPGLDWNMWLGPAPARPYNYNRWGVGGNDRWSTFRYFWDYAGGAMTDWGVHLLDVVQFAFDEAMPVGISAQGGKFYVTDNTETPDTMIATYRYPGFIGAYESRTANPYPLYNATYGTAFHGTEATLMVNRAGYTIFPNAKDAQPVVVNNREMVEMNVPHWRDFLESIRTRRKPASDIETCVRSTLTCVLANIALRAGVSLEWDARSFTVKQAEAAPYLKAVYRAPWKLEV